MKRTNGKRLALGVLAAMAAYLALLALVSLLVVRGAVDESAGGVCVWAAAFAAAFVGAKTAAWGSTEQLAPSALGAAAFCALVLLLGFFVNDGLAPERVAAFAAATLAGWLLALLTRGGKKRKKRARRARK